MPPPSACTAGQPHTCSITRGGAAPPAASPQTRLASCSRRPPPGNASGHSSPLPRRRHADRLSPPSAVRRDAARQVVCSKTLVAKEGAEEEVAALCAGIVAALAPPTAGGPPAVRGVLEARLLTDAANPRTFHLWERYDSNRTLGEVNTGEAYATFMRAVAPMCEGPVGMALYEWKDGQLGAPAVQGGPKGEGGLDDATGGQGMAGGAGMKQTSAAVDLGNLERGDEGDAFGMPAKRSSGSSSVCSDGEGGGASPLNALAELQEKLQETLQAFKFPWEKEK